MFRFLIDSHIGPYDITIKSNNWNEAGPWYFTDDLPDIFKDALKSTLALHGRSVYGQGLEDMENIAPVDLEATFNALEDYHPMLVVGEREPLPKIPMDMA